MGNAGKTLLVVDLIRLLCSVLSCDVCPYTDLNTHRGRHTHTQKETLSVVSSTTDSWIF